MTDKELAEELGVKVNVVRKMARRGLIPCQRTGHFGQGKYVFELGDVLQAIYKQSLSKN